MREGVAAVTEKELIDNHQRYLERVALYKKFGYDVDKERAFIIERARPFSGNILEVGTGKGYFTLALARAGYNFFSFDIAAEEQRYALLNLMYHRLQQQVTFGIADVECIPCDDGFFDVIFAVNMVHHLASVRKTCKELVRILSPSGKIVLSDFNAHGLAIVDKIHEMDGRKHELNSGTMVDARAGLMEHGLIINEYESSAQEMLVASRI